MTPVQFIIILALYIVLELIAYYSGWNKIKKTTNYDSPKDTDYYKIGESLKVSDSIELNQQAAAPGSMILVEYIEETNTFIFERSPLE